MDLDHAQAAQWFTDGGTVAEVDPADLESVLQLCGGVQPPEDWAKASDSSLFKQVCTPGADVIAVWYRASILQLCARVNLLSAWLHDGILDKTVVRVAARFPMKKMEVGVVHSSLPIDLAEFVKQVEVEPSK